MQAKRTSGESRRGIWRTCQECGKDFRAKADCATRTSKYCSSTCSLAVQSRAALAATPPADELRRLYVTEGLSITALGRHYGKSQWWASQALARRGIALRPRRSGSEVACEVCGKPVYVSPSEFARNRRFCSKACAYKGMDSPATRVDVRQKNSEGKRGAKNPMWHGRDTEGSIYLVFSARLKGETCCRNCGDSPGLLHLHHIVPRSMCKAGRRDMRNGVTLCPRCHRAWHHREITIYRDIFTDEEWTFVSSLQLLGQDIGAWLDDRYPTRPVPLTSSQGRAA